MSQWQKVEDPKTGGVYYHNKETNETSWTLPSDATVPAEMRVNSGSLP
jgi:hypothetical protein